MNKFQKRRMALGYVFLIISVGAFIAMDRAMRTIIDSIDALGSGDYLGGSSADFDGALITLTFGGIVAGISVTLAIALHIYSARD